jgi:hypothetical protein
LAGAEIPPAHAGHGWLAVIVPADARSFRVTDSALEGALRYAGADLVDERPDVEIAAPTEIRGDADCAVVVIAEQRPEGGMRLVRGARRAARSLSARLRAARASRTLRVRGYARVSTLMWALDRPFPLAGLEPTASVRLPVWALVIGRRRAAPSMLAAAAAAAGVQLEQPPNVRQGVVVGMTVQGVLRVAIGPAERQIDEQTRALERLRELEPESALADLAPRVLRAGRAGLARWALEQRLPGRRPAAVDEHLRAECLEFLVELFSLGARLVGSDPTERASVVASQCGPREAAQLEVLAARLTQSLEGVQGGFAHGDFWSENLLTHGDRLTGVVDWDYAGEGRLPLLDLFHLLVNEERRQRRIGLGRAFTGCLLPSVREGGGPEVRELCRRIGLEADSELLKDLALSYWLDYVARQLELYADRAARPVWMRDNVSAVLRAAVT